MSNCGVLRTCALVLAGCATARPIEAPAPLPAEETPAAPPLAPVPQQGARGDASSVNGPEGLVALCEVLRDEASMTFPGNAVEQARAVESHAQARQAAMAASYVTTIPAAGFAFRGYELGERRLILDTNRGLVLGDGAELLMSSKEPAPGFALSPDSADHILAQTAAGKVGLRLVFRPAGSELRPDACMWLGGGRVVKMETELVGSALVAVDGTVLSRGDTGEYADPSIAAPVRSPRVRVRKPRTSDGREVPANTAAVLALLAEAARPCYERTLSVRPALRGTLVLAVRIGSGGRVEGPHVEMSSLGDDALASCVAAAAAKVVIGGANPGQRFSVPLEFGSADD